MNLSNEVEEARDAKRGIGDPDDKKRTTAVENHYKWADAAEFLGCHSIRVNAASKGSFEEQQKLAADGLHRLTEYAEKKNLNVIVENHGGLSSNGEWLAGVMKMVDHPHCGTLPDFGNFSIARPTKEKPDVKAESYDSYVGVKEMMPLAKGVSVKPTVWDFHGKSGPIDLPRMMKIVVDAETRRILGATILGTGGDEAIHAVLDCMYAKATAADLQRMVHLHPTVAELLPTIAGELVPFE